ncbi:Polysaccharide monooxygenase Cel61a [Madurella mycetomatis]|uniref:lytic cellulose monooxygenase (C4-dehydrogenating) n=1 Tax=Madurella mycetomatis TaxID=100816 RepID=A0A175VQX1_9PEZI|nr:Polysaccharide monooxygenase Cel61a [Madurella mycetomatis]
MFSSLATVVFLAAAEVAAHGFVEFIHADGVQYQGYNPGFRFQDPAPRVPGWYANNTDIGFVGPESFRDPDIICHKIARPGQEYVNVRAGSNITLQWMMWPESHVGPIMDYLAPCPSSGCVDTDKTQLEFVKLAQQALKPDATPSTFWLEAWVVDDFRKNSYKWVVNIPSDIKSGYYVLRHEIIALHSAWGENGAQAYPQCINLHVTDGGDTEVSGGTSPMKFYDAEHPGIHISVYDGLTTYPYPGPALWR